MPNNSAAQVNRRNFLTGAAALIGGLAIEQAIPFGRVWSFPSKIVIPKTLKFNPDAFVQVFKDYDIHRAVAVQRVDVLYGWHTADGTPLPR